MRNFLCRGMRADGIWVYGYYFAKPILNRAFILLGEEQWEIDPDTAGRDTGLTDKNGTKIFEGDIVTIGGGNEPLYVAFIDFSWYLVSKRHKYYKHRPEAEEAYTVIGNIYENPEPLEGVI